MANGHSRVVAVIATRASRANISLSPPLSNFFLTCTLKHENGRARRPYPRFCARKEFSAARNRAGECVWDEGANRAPLLVSCQSEEKESGGREFASRQNDRRIDSTARARSPTPSEFAEGTNLPADKSKSRFTRLV